MSSDFKEKFQDLKSENECDKFLLLKDYSIFLFHLFDILSILLKNLLSSHVDNYRDNIVIENTVSLLIILINYLVDIYSNDKINTSFSNLNFYENSNLYLLVVEYVQKLFENVLEAFREICKFNTTIKLNFEKILEKIAEKPSNLTPMVYILNFMFNVVNNEYTIETFLDFLRKVQKQPQTDVYNELETNIKQSMKIGHYSDEKNLIQFLVELGINSNNDFMITNIAGLLISVQKADMKGKTNEQLCEYLISHINNFFSKISKLNIALLEEKEIDNFIPNIENIYRTIRFILIFIKSEFKFIYIFHDISEVFLKIFIYFNDYLLKSNENENKKLKNSVLDLINLLMDNFIVICDSKEGFYKNVLEDNTYYDLVEEIPNKNHILNIIKQTKGFLENLKEIYEKNRNDKTILTKFLIICDKSAKIYIKLCKNFYGQNLFLYSDYPQILPKIGKPMLKVTEIFEFIVEVFSVNTNENTNIENQFKNEFLEILEKLIIIVTLLLYDLNYYEISNSTILNFENIFTTDSYFYDEDNEDQNRKLFTISETRLNSILYLLTNNSAGYTENIPKSLHNLIQVDNSLNSLLALNDQDKINKINNLIKNVNLIKKIIFNIKDLNIINAEVKTVKLPNPRKNNDKYDVIQKYYEYYFSQGYAYNLPIQGKDTKDSSSITYINQYNDYSRQYIYEFEKLLNWKKYRILLTKMDNLITKTSIFDLDFSLKYQPDDIMTKAKIDPSLIYECVSYKRKFSYTNYEPFEQFCNQLFNENLILNKFSNISYSATSATIHKLYIVDSYNVNNVQLFYKNQTNYKFGLEFIKNKPSVSNIFKGSGIVQTVQNIRTSKNTQLINFKFLEKKVNSKLNTFIYKPKYDKLPKQQLLMPTPNSSNYLFKFLVISIRDNNRYASMVSGRPLSEHVDKFAPRTNVVNLTNPLTDESQQIELQLEESKMKVDEEIINLQGEKTDKNENANQSMSLEVIDITKDGAINQPAKEITQLPAQATENKMINPKLNIIGMMMGGFNPPNIPGMSNMTSSMNPMTPMNTMSKFKINI